MITGLLIAVLAVQLALLLVGALIFKITRQAVNADSVYGYHVTYILWKDHDFRNAGVPAQECLSSGLAWRTLSTPVKAENDTVVFSPTQLKLNLASMLKDTEITSIDILCLLPLSKAEFEHEVAVISSLPRM